ncbi:hypothetical protein HY733_00770 [Candidatus Uhrbacteria bacterium]|nr:hypothetical protein [Candidatus Uhrbacteria bacterium]
MPKTTCEEAKQLPISFLKKRGFFGYGPKSGDIRWSIADSQTGSIDLSVDAAHQAVRCSYTVSDENGEKHDYDYAIPIVRTSCFFGGSRYWFSCIGCKKRVGILYAGRRYFLCRTCLNFCYESQLTTHTGTMGFYIRFIHLDTSRQNGFQTRTKLFRRRPTKRYERWLRKHDMIRDVARSASGLDIAQLSQ